MKKYSVSLVYEKKYDNKIEHALKVLIVKADDKIDALESTQIHFDSETIGYDLVMKVILEI